LEVVVQPVQRLKMQRRAAQDQTLYLARLHPLAVAVAAVAMVMD
jgi:hypothetical protein